MIVCYPGDWCFDDPRRSDPTNSQRWINFLSVWARAAMIRGRTVRLHCVFVARPRLSVCISSTPWPTFHCLMLLFLSPVYYSNLFVDIFYLNFFHHPYACTIIRPINSIYLFCAKSVIVFSKFAFPIFDMFFEVSWHVMNDVLVLLGSFSVIRKEWFNLNLVTKAQINVNSLFFYC